MRKIKLTNPIVLAVFIILLAGCRTEKKKDQSTDAREEVTPLVDPVAVLENGFVKVAYVSLNPGEALLPHEGEERLVYSLSDYTIEWEQDGEDPGTRTWKRGEVHPHKAGEHSAENTGDSRAEWVTFVKKTTELPVCEGLSPDNDVNSVAGDAAELLYEDDNFRVTEISLGPGESLPQHQGVNRVIYALSDYTIRYMSGESEAMEKSFSKGEAHWHEGCRHALENTGATPARFLVVAFKNGTGQGGY